MGIDECSLGRDDIENIISILEYKPIREKGVYVKLLQGTRRSHHKHGLCLHYLGRGYCSMIHSNITITFLALYI